MPAWWEARLEMGAPWRIELFGGLRGVQGNSIVERFRTEKTASLLAYLALHKGRPQSREVLCELLWPEVDPGCARQSLSTALWSLRRQFQQASRNCPLPLDAGRSFVCLDAGRITTDVAEFEEAVGRKEPSPEAVTGWRRAIALYREPLAAGAYDDWVAIRQDYLRRQLLEVLLRLIDHLRETGHSREAISFARRAVAVDPMSEQISLALMQTLAAEGEVADVVREYQRLERELHGGLCAQPGERVRAELFRLTAIKVNTEKAPEGRKLPSSNNLPGPSDDLAVHEVEAVGGAVPLHSRFYVERKCDREFAAAVDRKEMLILLKGAGQMGKSSLLARGVDRARAAGSRIVLCDIQKLNHVQLATPAALFLALAQWMAIQLSVEVSDLSEGIETLGPSIGFEWFMRRQVLEQAGHFVWVLDEADRFFAVPHGVEFFRLIRSWYNERALDPAGPWNRMSVILAYSTEAHLLIPDPNQSPFNVGQHVELEDLAFAEVSHLNDAYGSPLRDKGEISRLIDLLGGHPHLIRTSLNSLAARAAKIDWVEQQARMEGGLFRAHLAHLRAVVRETTGAAKALQEMVDGAGISNEEAFFGLRSAGLITGANARTARFRCRLYARHFGGRSSG